MYQIVTDGAWDMDSERAKALDVAVVPFYVATDGENYLKEIEERSVRDVYEFMVEHPNDYPKTAQPSVEDYLKTFEKYASQGMDIICFCLSAKFTGSMNAAMIARDQILEQFDNIRIEVMDSMLATVMQGLMIQELVRFKRAGAAFEDVIAKAKYLRDTARIFFTVENMNYLIHGGRVGKLAGVAANVLNLRPMILMTQGELFPMGLARGRSQSKKKAMEKLFSYIKENGNDPDKFAYIVGYGYDIEEGEKLRSDAKKQFEKNWPDKDVNIDISQIGMTIGVHTGPHPIGFGLIEKAC